MSDRSRRLSRRHRPAEDPSPALRAGCVLAGVLFVAAWLTLPSVREQLRNSGEETRLLSLHGLICNALIQNSPGKTVRDFDVCSAVPSLSSASAYDLP